MAKIYLVRHGRAAAGFAEAADPGLDALGREQAQAMAEKLAPLDVPGFLASPLRRTRETAAALEKIWHRAPRIETRVAEIPSPSPDLAARGAWLQSFMAGVWGDGGERVLAWREGVVEALLELEQDTIVVSHFVAINAAVGAATGDERVVIFRPDNCSCTRLESANGKLELLELGAEAPSEVR